MFSAVLDVAITKGHDEGLCPKLLQVWAPSAGRQNYRRKMSVFPLSLLLWALFLESPDGFSGLESCSKFSMFTFKINVLRNLKMIQWNYQSSKQNWLVCEPRTMLLFNRFWFEYLILGAVSYQNFQETNPRRQNPWPTTFTISPDFIQNNLDSFTFFSSLDFFPASFLVGAFVVDIVASFCVAFPSSCFIKRTIHWSLISYIIWARTTKKIAEQT